MNNKKKQRITSLHVKIGDMVEVITGKDKGKTGEVIQVFKKKQQAIVKGINLKIKHVKPTRANEPGQITQNEFPVHSSNLMLYSEKQQLKSRLEHVFDDNNKKMRRLKKTQEILK